MFGRKRWKSGAFAIVFGLASDRDSFGSGAIFAKAQLQIGDWLEEMEKALVGREENLDEEFVSLDLAEVNTSDVYLLSEKPLNWSDSDMP